MIHQPEFRVPVGKAVPGMVLSRNLEHNGQLLLHRYSLTQASWEKMPGDQDWPAHTPNITVTATNEILFAPNGRAPSPATMFCGP